MDVTGSQGDTSGDALTDLVPYFSTSIYSGYHDEPGGFYEVYRTLFEQLWVQECEAAEAIGIKTPSKTYFGGSKSDYASLKKFYQFWTTFATLLAFEWCDEYYLPDVRFTIFY